MVSCGNVEEGRGSCAVRVVWGLPPGSQPTSRGISHRPGSDPGEPAWGMPRLFPSGWFRMNQVIEPRVVRLPGGTRRAGYGGPFIPGRFSRERGFAVLPAAKVPALGFSPGIQLWQGGWLRRQRRSRSLCVGVLVVDFHPHASMAWPWICGACLPPSSQQYLFSMCGVRISAQAAASTDRLGRSKLQA